MYSTGRNSPYGEQTLLLLQSLAEQGGLHCGSYAELYAASYSKGFDGYMNASTVVGGGFCLVTDAILQWLTQPGTSHRPSAEALHL
jgi:hypothetical protein